MPERKVKFKLGDKEVDAWDVPIEESIERWTELKLEDGTMLKIKVVVSNVMRLEGQKDDQGNPVYAVRSVNALLTVSSPTNPPRKVS